MVLKTLETNKKYIGNSIRALLEDKGFKSVAADGFKATSVIVSYTEDDAFQNGKIFAENGMQIAAGVPLECGEGSDFKTFRLGPPSGWTNLKTPKEQFQILKMYCIKFASLLISLFFFRYPKMRMLLALIS